VKKRLQGSTVCKTLVKQQRLLKKQKAAPEGAAEDEEALVLQNTDNRPKLHQLWRLRK